MLHCQDKDTQEPATGAYRRMSPHRHKFKGGKVIFNDRASDHRRLVPDFFLMPEGQYIDGVLCGQIAIEGDIAGIAEGDG